MPYASVLMELQNQQPIATYSYGDDLISYHQGTGSQYYLYDALGSTRALTNENGQITDSYNYDAFGANTEHQGSSNNKYQYAGEQKDSTGNYYLRARYYNPSIGRFTQMDSYMGQSNNPITLHKYLYANANPVMYTDPSGYFGLGGFGFGSFGNAMMSTARYGGYLMNVYDKVQLLVGFMDFTNAVRSVVGEATILNGDDTKYSGLPKKHGNNGTPVDFSEAAESFALNLPRVVGTGIGNWEKGYLSSKKNRNKLTAFLIHMPIVSKLPSTISIKVPTPARVTVGSQKVPVKLEFGGPKGAEGQLFGIGVSMGKDRQLFRMDYHEWHGTKTGPTGDEISVWRDGNYHYHVRQWNQ
ncbi:MAG: RHS repeat-associated core domain-containing protein [Moraxellaceae bacterium]|nr:RHS repeat-associated core domain-containing protein [Moraxellaceae bacterium]